MASEVYPYDPEGDRDDHLEAIRRIGTCGSEILEILTLVRRMQGPDGPTVAPLRGAYRKLGEAAVEEDLWPGSQEGDGDG